jgi:hypothetical protein
MAGTAAAAPWLLSMVKVKVGEPDEEDADCNIPTYRTREGVVLNL